MLGCSAGDLVCTAVLGSPVQRHETDARTQNALLLNAGQRQQLSEVHLLTMARAHVEDDEPSSVGL